MEETKTSEVTASEKLVWEMEGKELLCVGFFCVCICVCFSVGHLIVFYYHCFILIKKY